MADPGRASHRVPGVPEQRPQSARNGSGSRTTSWAVVSGSSDWPSTSPALARNASRRLASSAAARLRPLLGQGDPLLGLPPDLLGHAEQVDEHPHLGPQDLGHDRRGDVVHRPLGVALGGADLVGEGGEEDDRACGPTACRWRIRAAVSKPFMPGMLTSSRMTANSWRSTCAQGLLAGLGR